MKLSNKILFSVLPLISISLLVVGVVAFWQLKKVEEEKLYADMDNRIHTVDSQLNYLIQKTLTDSELIANNQTLKEFVLEQDEDQRYLLWHAALLRIFADIQTTLPQYYELRIIDPQGNELVRRVTADNKNDSEQEMNSGWFKNIQNSTESKAITLQNPDDGNTVIYTTKPLILRDARVESIQTPPSLRGYLVITAELDEIKSYINYSKPGKDGFMLALSNSGRLLFKPEALKPIPHIPVEKLISKQNIHLTIKDNELIYMTDKQNGHLVFVSAIPAHELFGATTHLAIIVLLITVGTIIMVTLVLYSIMRKQVLHPIRYLSSLSQKIGQGDLNIRNEYAQKDEFGELAQSFEDMALGLKDSADKIQFMAFHDSLTGLPNRAQFHQDMEQSMTRAKRNGDKFALLFVDIDDFKHVNDARGHQAGDQLLKAITQRVYEQLRESDRIMSHTNRHLHEQDQPLFSRIGGDEFAILLCGVDDPLYAGSVSQRLIEVIAKPFTIEGSELYVGASIGVAIFPEDSQTPDELIKYADIAMYHAKSLGKNNYQFYQESMNRKIHEKLHIESRLRLALEENRLHLMFQPQVNTVTRNLSGLEALIRWNDPELGYVSPDIFIPIAEDTGMILAIGEWVIQEACRQQAEWISQGLEPVTISVNVSGKQFDHQNVSDILLLAMAKNKLLPGHLGIEITESTAMTDPDETAIKLREISARGIKISLDDFGTGYSSLSHLQQFSVDVLKIDRSFVSGLTNGQQSKDLTNAIVVIAHLLNMSVIAEGVETQEQLTILHGFNCDDIQGAMFSIPLKVEEVPDMLNKRTFH